MNMESRSKNRIYRYRTQTSMRILIILAIVFGFILTVAFGVFIWLCINAQLSLNNHRWWVGLANLFIMFAENVVLLGVFIFYAVQEKLKTHNERIIVEDEGLRATNWKQKEFFFPWDTIRELKRAELDVIFPTLPAKVIADDGKVSISRAIECREALLDEIINRANLTEKSGNWYQARYSRQV